MLAEGGGGQCRVMEGQTIGKAEGLSQSGLSVRIVSLGPLLSFH